jgi:hypothetical protein
MAQNCSVTPVTECLFEVFETEQAAREACEDYWATNRRARVISTGDATALRIRADGTPDPVSKIEVTTPCFVVYSEG